MSRSLKGRLSRLERRRNETEEGPRIWMNLGDEFISPDGERLSREAYEEATKNARRFTIELGHPLEDF